MMFERLRQLLPSARRREDADMDEELRALAEMAEAEGDRKLLGNLTLAKENGRAVSKWQWLESTAADVRYAIRVLRRDRAFTCLTLATLALCIGANAAIFSLVDAVLIRTLPVHDPDRLAEFRNGSSSYYSYRRYEASSRDWFTGLLATGGTEEKSVDVGGGDFRARVELVTGNYFDVLGVPVAHGRLLSPHDDRRENPSYAAVIADGFWRQHFGARPDVIGRTVRVQGVPLTVVGVAPREFFGVAVGNAADIWAPLALQPILNPTRIWLDKPNNNFLTLIGRLKQGASMTAAAEALTPIMHDIDLTRAGKHVPPQFESLVRKSRMTLTPATYGISRLRARFSQPLRIVFCMVGIALLLGCVNILNLQLARSSERRRELAVRLAVGAGRGRLVRQLLVESLLVTSVAAAIGVALSQPAAKALASVITQHGQPIVLNSEIDGSLLWFVCALAAAAALISGLLPAVQATRGRLWSAVQSGGQSITAGRDRRWLRYSLICVQSGLSLFLVAAASIFGVSLTKLMQFDVGLDRENLAIIDVDATEAGYEGARALALAESLAERLRAVPGVLAVSYSQNGLFTGRNSTNLVTTEGFTDTDFDARKVWFDVVGPRFLTAIKAQLVTGRDFNEQDRAGAPNVAIVSESFARHFFGERNPIGRTVTLEPRFATFEVTGIVRDMRVEGVREQPRRWLYLPALQATSELWGTRFVVRTSGSPQSSFGSFRHVIREENAHLPIVSMDAAEELLARTFDRDRLLASLATAFGVLSLLIAAVGIYGLLSYDMVKRTQEMGVRMALGAKRAAIVRLMLRETILMCTLGIAAGTAGALACGKYVESLLFGLHANDPVVLGGAAVVLAGVALLAAGVPAFRAGSVNPVRALRHE